MKPLANILIKVVAIITLLASCFYTQTEIYDFSEPQPFIGDHFYNPYSQWDTTNVLKANFHAHSSAWGGTTNGKNSPSDIIQAYKEKNYDIIGISNYFNIDHSFDTSKLYIPLYEHGLNFLKTHKQAINPKGVLYFDFPFFQNTSQKQQIINKLKEKSALVSVNHPKFMNGHSKTDLTLLQGYHFLEVLNHYRISDDYWDYALSAGKLVWILGDDDTHDIHKGGWNSFVMWTMINSHAQKDSILESMKKGKMYGMRGRDATIWNELVSCKIINDTLSVKFKQICDSIQLIGQNGQLIKLELKAHSISLPTDKIETYVRCKANTSYHSIYTNPIIRYDGKHIPYNYEQTPEVNFIKTWLYRLVIILINVIFMWLAFFRKQQNSTSFV